MHLVETIGAVLIGGGFTGAVAAGFVLYLATHGVPLSPNPSRPGSAGDTPERRAFFERVNARAEAVLRVLFPAFLVVGVLGLLLLIVAVVAF